MNLSAARVTRLPQKTVAPSGIALHRFSVDDYHRMIDAGILTTDHKVELLDGWIINQMPQKPPHSSSVRRVSRVVGNVLPEGWFPSAQLPITLAASEPEPDLAIVRGPEENYDDRHPQAVDIGLLMEISKESLIKDRHDKGLIYAQAKIPHYWIINLATGAIEVYSRPRNGRQPKYHQRQVFRKGEKVPLFLDGVLITEIPVKDLVQ